MKHIFLLSILFALTYAEEKRYNPTPDRDFDVHHIRIEIEIDIRGESVEGNVTNTFSPLQTNLSRISLDSEHTVVSSVTLNGKKSLTFEAQEKKLEIDLEDRKSVV